ncbi:MAG: hypothetical protein KBT00_06960 [Bacteroidales bacterium]|nr:hypothetical protein [Candidatus Cacconaster merdequi]
MKHSFSLILAAVLFLSAAGTLAYGQEHKPAGQMKRSVRVWYSTYLANQALMLKGGSKYYLSSEYYHWDGGRMNYIYCDYSSEISADCSFGADFSYSFSKRFTLNTSIGFTPLSFTNFNVIQGTSYKHRAAVLILMPEARLNYMNKDMVRLYGEVGLGFGFKIGMDSSVLCIQGQFVPFGIEVGRKWFVFAETGAGSSYCGVQMGAGYRF